jgi:hypothetical protein
MITAAHYDRHVEGAAKEIAAAKWTVKVKQYGGTIARSGPDAGKRTPVHKYEINVLSYKQMDSLAEWVETACDEWTNGHGQTPSDEVESYANDVAREVLVQMGYDVAPDADYDWVCEHLGSNAETIYVDAAQAITDCVWEDYVRYER